MERDSILVFTDYSQLRDKVVTSKKLRGLTQESRK